MHNLYEIIWSQTIVSSTYKSSSRQKTVSFHYKFYEQFYIKISFFVSYKCQDYFGQSDCDAAFITYNLLKNHIQKEHKNPSNEQKPAKRKRVSKSYLNVIQMEDDDNIEYIDEEDVVGSSFGKRSKESSRKSNNEARTDNDSFEIIVTNEISADADDNEYVIEYKDEVNAYSE